MRVLIAEDNPRMAGVLRRALQREGYVVLVASDGEQALNMGLLGGLDILVLDVMMPRLDGFDVVRHLRAAKQMMPAILVTARDSMSDIVRGLDSGADDYLTKPFPLDVLLARMRALSRRGAIPRPVCLEVADLKLDPASHRVSRAEETLSLTPREYRLLELLMRNHGRAV